MKNLFVFTFLLLCGCFLYVESGTHPRDTAADGGGWEVWLEYPYIHCTYDAYWDLSEWHFEIYADSYYGPYEVMAVGFFINNHDYQEMEYAGGGFWVDDFYSTYYDCDRPYHFDFVATDYNGYEGYYTYYW